jgi:hypothetical protein
MLWQRQRAGGSMDHRPVDDAQPRSIRLFERAIAQQINHPRQAAREL